MPRFNFIGAMTLALVLGGCASREELAARHMTMLEGKCASYGYQKGTSPWSQCLKDLDIAYLNAESRREGAAAQGSTICNTVGTTVICN
jgi:hypothetical protein